MYIPVNVVNFIHSSIHDSTKGSATLRLKYIINLAAVNAKTIFPSKFLLI